MMFAFAVLIAAVLSDDNIIDVTTDGKVKKTVLTKGTGTTKPLPNQKVEIRYNGWLPDGKLFDSSNAKGGSLTFVVGRGVIPAWSLAVQTMTVGEKAKIAVHYQYGFGERGYPPIIPARADLTFELELVQILAE
jgi:FKBP-type peptidyl-prolyl cis-trans isomerase